MSSLQRLIERVEAYGTLDSPAGKSVMFEAALQAQNDGVVICSAEREVLFANRMATEIFRCDLTGQKIDVLIPEDFRVPHAMIYQRFVQEADRKSIDHSIEVDAVIPGTDERVRLHSTLAKGFIMDELFIISNMRFVTDIVKMEDIQKRLI